MLERIIIYNCKEEKKIAGIAANMRIKSITVPKEESDMIIGEFLSGNYKTNKCEDAAGKEAKDTSDNETKASTGNDISLIIFCDLTDKHFDKMLGKLKEHKIDCDYKAVLTKTNEKWTIKKLLIYLEMERKCI